MRFAIIVLYVTLNFQSFAQANELTESNISFKDFTILYKPGSYELSRKGKESLGKFALVLKDTSRKFYLIGYGCCRDDAIRISHKRIEVILNYLQSIVEFNLSSINFMFGVESGAGPNMVDVIEGTEGAPYSKALFPNLIK